MTSELVHGFENDGDFFTPVSASTAVSLTPVMPIGQLGRASASLAYPRGPRHRSPEITGAPWLVVASVFCARSATARHR